MTQASKIKRYGDQECPKCGFFVSHNPEDPTPPHKKLDSDEWCVTEE